MTFMSFSHTAALVLAVSACVTDVRSRRIPNVLTFGFAAAALVFHALDGGVSGLMMSVGGWLAGVLMMGVPFALGGLGAGDVKLAAALGAWLGPMAAVWIGLYSGVAGGVMALAVAVSTGYLRTAWSNISLLLMHWRLAGPTPLDGVTLATSGGPRLAYAAPILVGTVVTLWLR
jgi:prepilin peptidase CpaA